MELSLKNISEYNLEARKDSYESVRESCKNLLRYYTNCKWQREMRENENGIEHYTQLIKKIDEELETRRKNN